MSGANGFTAKTETGVPGPAGRTFCAGAERLRRFA